MVFKLNLTRFYLKTIRSSGVWAKVDCGRFMKACFWARFSCFFSVQRNAIFVFAKNSLKRECMKRFLFVFEKIAVKFGFVNNITYIYEFCFAHEKLKSADDLKNYFLYPFLKSVN